MKGVVKYLTSYCSVVLVCATLGFALPVKSQTHCDACGPYNGICQGIETYVNLDGTMSTGAGALTFSWTSDCPNADLLDPTSATPILILYNPGLGVAANCKVYLEINDHGACGCKGNCSCVDQCETEVNISACQLDCAGTINGTKVIDRCGVCNGDGNSCLGCSNVDITDDQFVLDGNTHGLKKLIEHANNSLAKLARTAKDKKFVADARKEAKKVYNLSWSYVWSLPHIITSCTNQIFCTSTSNTGTIQNFNSTSNQLNQLLKSVIKKTQKLRRKKLAADARNLLKGDNFHQENLTISGGVPALASACTAP